jgi:transposase-like protein
MRPNLIVCPFCEWRNCIGVHSHQQRRYICHACNKTFAATIGTPWYGLKYPAWMVTVVLALLASGCPPQAIVFAFDMDEQTVTDWQVKAGLHTKEIQEQVVCQGQVDLGQVQADE